MRTSKRRGLNTRALVGAVVLTASFTLLPVGDDTAEAAGKCGFVFGTLLEGSDGTGGTSNCIAVDETGFESESRGDSGY